MVEEVEEVEVEEKQWATPRGNEGRLGDVVQHQRACRERERERAISSIDGLEDDDEYREQPH